jgi:hypothetical protein
VAFSSFFATDAAILFYSRRTDLRTGFSRPSTGLSAGFSVSAYYCFSFFSTFFGSLPSCLANLLEPFLGDFVVFLVYIFQD